MATHPTSVSRKATPAQRRLATALEALHVLQAQGHGVFNTSQFSRTDREALLAARYLQPVIQGWYMSRTSLPPIATPGSAPTGAYRRSTR